VTPAIRAHLAVWGRWCPGWSGRGHHVDDLTARAGRVLCGSCADAVLHDREQEVAS
jgi:hypothetical protein